MILRKLSIFGFKSFAEKTELEFGEGMTAVIGPNGCGKSNVVDAIRWVLGEQKVTLLRSAAMQDVIFSGTQSRQPLNLSEVTLTIENNKGILPVEYSEVAITRRIFRNGEGEYLINKVPCRLRDIHTLFLDTGVGSSAYTTIERGMIDSILSDKAEERRTLFEEAAGIGKYKQRRKESLRQLDKTKQDMLRINDKVQEADRMVRMLARHVEKAQRYKTYRDDLKRVELGYWNRSFTALVEAVNGRKTRLDELVARREMLRAQIATGESQVETLRITALEKEKELDVAARNVGEMNEKIIVLERDLSVSQERRKSLAESIAAIDRDVQQIDSQIEENTLLCTQLEKAIVERDSVLERYGEKMQGLRDDLCQFDSRLEAERATSDRVAREQIELINTISDTRNTVSTLKSNLANAIDRRERALRELQVLEERIEGYREAVTASRKQLETADLENRNLLQSREMLLSRVDKEEHHYRELVEREKRCEAQEESSLAQLKFLEGLDAAFEGYEAGVKELLTRQLPGMKGIVADLVRVADQDAIGLVENVLGTAVQTVVFDTEENLTAAMNHLRGEKAGSARMIALDRIPAAPAAQNGDMRAMIETSEGCEALREYLLADMILTESGEQALRLAVTAAGRHTFVGRDGVIADADGTVIAGEAKTTVGILQRKQEITHLGTEIERLRSEHVSVLHDKEICIINRDGAKKALVEVDEKLNRGQRLSQEQQTKIRHYENELLTVTEKAESLHAENADITTRIERLEAEAANAETEVTVHQNRYDSLEAEVERMRGSVRAMEDERRAKVEHLKNAELEEQGLTTRVKQDKHDVERLVRENEKSFSRKQQKMGDKERSLVEIGTIENGLVQSEQDQQAFIVQRTELEAVRDAIREEYNGQLLTVDELRKNIKNVQGEFEELANTAHAAELDQSRDEQEQRRIRESMFEKYELDISAPSEPLPEVTEDDEELLKTMEMLRERIKRVGEVNMSAFAEYETESARLHELTTQRDDLQKAIDDLEQAIKKLDKEARAQFVTTFEQVQKNFTEMFTTLFVGGEATLSLEENADPLEATIHINVRPAGKKMRGVQLLSAGERALTAISLLFALYLVKPSAYCILDELDAPLDEANTVRFINVLKKFADLTQFIVITHNKRTMEAADVLYGVTQRESGVSTVVSVSFNEGAPTRHMKVA